MIASSQIGSGRAGRGARAGRVLLALFALAVLPWAGAQDTEDSDSETAEEQTSGSSGDEQPKESESLLIDETRFFSEEQKTALRKQIERLRSGHGFDLAVVALPATIGETLYSDAKKKVRDWFTSKGKLGGVFLIHRGSQEAILATNLHLRTPVRLQEVIDLHNAAVREARDEKAERYEDRVYKAAMLVLERLPDLVDEGAERARQAAESEE